jgi:NADPH2:quinone reductase
MRAIAVPEYGEATVLEAEQRPRPEPGPAEVRLDVRATGVNFADIEQRRGRYRGGPEAPFVPGLEASGVVDTTGADVERWAPGDEVVCFLADGGGYAEQAVTPAEYMFPKPERLSFEDAGGTLIQAFTAHNALHEWGGVEAGDTVLINAAAGGVGSTATRLAAIAGAEVLATASASEKLAYARECGADHGINYVDADVVDTVAHVTDGEGVDLLLDGVGGDAFADGFEALAPGGTAVTYGAASGDISTVATPRLFYQNKSVAGYHLMYGLEEIPERVLSARSHLFDLVASGNLSVSVESVRDLGEAAAVHRAIENRETRGRVVLTP